MAINFNERRLRQVFEGPRGDVARMLGRVGAKMETAAKTIAREEGLVRTGRYRNSISWTLARDGGGLSLRLSASAPYAGFLERGTPRHVILPRRPKYALWWKDIVPGAAAVQTGRNTFFTESGEKVGRHPVARVNHPGNRAYRVLTRAVEQVARGGL